MTDPRRFSQSQSDLFGHSDLFGLFKAELARSDAMTGLVDAGASLWPRFAACYQSVVRLPRKARRALQRRWRRSLGGIALLCALGHAPAVLAAQIDVGGGCTLVDAINAANDNQPRGGCPAGSGPDTITLPAGSTQLLTSGAYSSGLPVISSAIVIDGNGSTIARDPQAPQFRILAVASAGDLVLEETTVTGGVISTSIGGGILNFGTLTLTNSTVSGNSGTVGGGLRNSNGTLTLTNSTVSGNSAFGGGGVSNSGTLTLTNSTVSGNSAIYGGGGVDNNYSSGKLTLTNSTVSGNSAGLDGGGLYNRFGTLTLTNSTVSGNFAGRDGGGLRNYSGTLTLTRTLVSGNTSASGAEAFGTVIANNFNLFGHSGLGNAQAFAGFTPGPTDLTATSNGTTPTALGAILGITLSNNGGPTQTHALVLGSPAIDAVATGCPPPPTDQRGVSRPQGPKCDIGAFELITSGTADLAVSLTDSPDPLTVNGQLTYTITARNNSPAAVSGLQVTDTLPAGTVLAGPASSSQGNCGGARTVVCNLGTLPSGAQATVTINVIPTVARVFSNSATAVANEPDLNPANNTATETTTVREPLPENADVAVTAAATPDPGASGQPLTYTLTVRNNGPQTATGVELTDDLPDGVVLDGPAIPNQGDCRGTDPVSCSLGTLPSGAEAIVTIDVIPTAAATLTNRATVNLNETDPDVANNSATIMTTIEPPLALTSQAACSTVRCALRLACNQAESLGDNCENDVTLFVRARSARLGDPLPARAPKRMIRFASAVTNIPPGRTGNVRLRLTNRGQQIARRAIQQGTRRLRGILEIRNTTGGGDTIRLTVRLR